MLDFGSTEPLPHGWPARLGPLLAALRDRDAAAAHELAVRTGLLDASQVSAAAFSDLVGPYAEPLRAPEFTFRRAWLQEQTRRSSDPRGSAARVQRHLRVPTQHLLVQRVAVGLAGVLTSLRARVAVDAEVRRWVPGCA